MGGFGYRELMTRDPAASRAFWGPLLGFGFAEVDEGYTHVLRGGRRIGGMVRAHAGLDTVWQSYVTVGSEAEVDAIAGRARAAGGRVLAGPAPLPGVGRFVMVMDPDGAWLGAVHAEPAGGPFCWETLATRNRERARPFYAEVFGFTSVAQPGVELLLSREGERMADLQDARTQAPRWSTYARVDGLDGALIEAERLGGRVVVAPFEVAGFGRIAVVAGVDGATLGLVA